MHITNIVQSYLLLALKIRIPSVHHTMVPFQRKQLCIKCFVVKPHILSHVSTLTRKLLKCKLPTSALHWLRRVCLSQYETSGRACKEYYMEGDKKSNAKSSLFVRGRMV